MKYSNQILLILFTLLLSCSENNIKNEPKVYQDKPYIQDYAIKFYFEDEIKNIKKVYCDRNDVIQILADNRLFIPFNGHLQYPGKLKLDLRYMPMQDKKVRDIHCR